MKKTYSIPTVKVTVIEEKDNILAAVSDPTATFGTGTITSGYTDGKEYDIDFEDFDEE